MHVRLCVCACVWRRLKMQIDGRGQHENRQHRLEKGGKKIL